MSCPSDNSADTGDNCFFCPDGIHWDAHVIGWAVAGGCAALTTLITLFTLTMHATHYQTPAAQKQVMRVLMMPCVYSVISFLSYRYYRTYEYYYLCETAYEAITLSAFLMLLMELVSLNSSDHEIREVLAEKDKRKLPFPFNCWRFRASKPYFMHTLSFSVMQYVVFRPLLSIIGLVCEYFNVEYSVHFAEVYLDAFDFVSISVALYGLIVFYVLCKDELKGRKPLSKFLAIKLIVFFTFYQSFLFSVLQNYGVIKATTFWTADNVSDGLSALCTTVEMVFFSIYMGWAYNWTDYTNPKINPVQRPTGFKTYCQAIWDTINLTDFVLEIWHALVFFVNYMRGKPGTRGHTTQFQKTFMPPAEDDQTQMDKLGQNPYLRDKYSTDYNAVTGAGAGAGGAPSESYGAGQRTFRRTSSGTLIDTLRSPNSYQRLAEQSVMDQRQHSASGRAGVGARGWDDLRNANANANVNASEIAPAPGYSPGAYGASYSSQPTGTGPGHTNQPADKRPTLSLSPSDVQSNRQSSGSYSSPRRIRPPSFPQPQPTGPTPTDSRSPVTPADRAGYYHPYSSRQPEEEVTEWPAARPASYMNEGLPGNPRLY